MQHGVGLLSLLLQLNLYVNSAQTTAMQERTLASNLMIGIWNYALNTAYTCVQIAHIQYTLHTKEDSLHMHITYTYILYMHG